MQEKRSVAIAANVEPGIVPYQDARRMGFKFAQTFLAQPVIDDRKDIDAVLLKSAEGVSDIPWKVIWLKNQEDGISSVRKYEIAIMHFQDCRLIAEFPVELRVKNLAVVIEKLDGPHQKERRKPTNKPEH